MDIRQLIDKRSVQLKKGLLTDAEIKKLVTEWRDERSEEDLAQATIDREVKTMEEKLSKYNVSQLGDIPIKREDVSFRILVCQRAAVPGRRSGNSNLRSRRGSSTNMKLTYPHSWSLTITGRLWPLRLPSHRGFATKKGRSVR